MQVWNKYGMAAVCYPVGGWGGQVCYSRPDQFHANEGGGPLCSMGCGQALRLTGQNLICSAGEGSLGGLAGL